MTARGHILLATATIGAINYALHLNIDAYFLGGVILGSILPDLDEPQSLIGRKLGIIAYILRFLGLEHRTLSHSILFSLIFLIPAILFPYPFNSVLLGIGVGIILHCIGDMLTKSGLKYFLYPYQVELHLLPKELRFRTGSITEEILIIILLIANYFLYKNSGILDQLKETQIDVSFLKEFYYYFLHMIK